MSPNDPVRVLLADDHALVRAGFVTLFKDLGAEVVGEADKTADVIPKFEALKPDVVVLDIRFGGGQTGLEAAEQLLAKHPEARIVFLSQFDQNSLITRTYQLGGKAYLTKDCDPAEAKAALTAASLGQTYYMPKVARALAELHVRGDQSPQNVLSPRDLQIFIGLAKSLTLEEIATQLGIHAKTVSNASQSIKSLLGLERPADFTLLAVKSGLIQP